MKSVEEKLLKVTAQVMAHDLLLNVLVRANPALQQTLHTLRTLDLAQLAAQHAPLPVSPEVADMLADEFQEAWQSLLQRVLG